MASIMSGKSLLSDDPELDKGRDGEDDDITIKSQRITSFKHSISVKFNERSQLSRNPRHAIRKT
jgi:hypothetical protein